MKSAVTRTGARAGFTLIELLAVMLIIAILVAVLVQQLGDSERAVKTEKCRTDMLTLQSAIKAYATDNGSPPPSSFVPSQEVGNDGTNVGIEALVVALFSKGHNGGGLINDLKDRVINSDNDRSTKQLTDFGGRELFEIPDPWMNPIAYIERADYGVTNRRYLTVESATSQEIESIPLAFKNPTTGQYYANSEFQLISAGEDGRFGTEDDVTTFKRE